MIIVLIIFSGSNAAMSRQVSPLQPVIDGFMMKFLKHQMEIEPNENIFFSPFSVQSILTLVMGGARGETESSMRTALGYIHNDERLKDRESLKKEFDGVRKIELLCNSCNYIFLLFFE